jgi:nitric oxide reductase subunit B
MRGQQIWQTMGGMEVGSVWGHGSYVAPDWTADWLHRESESILDAWANGERGRAFAEIGAEAQGALQARLRLLMRTNDYDPTTGTLTIAPVRAQAFEANAGHYAQVFRDGQVSYAIPAGTVTDAERLRALSAFFFWGAWAAAAERPGTNISYTSNWPHEPLVGNLPTGETVVWTGVSILMLLAGLGGFIWYYAARPEPAPAADVPPQDPLLKWIPTPSQRATIKFFIVVAALFLLQILTGAITAHYGVEGDGLYGIPLSRVLPYSITRTWHLQLGLFWIATSWLAAGLFIAPLVGGKEPPGQRLGVNVLFAALVLVVGGSMVGEYLSIHNYLTDTVAFYLGHQGYEYLDLGRVWQAALFVGLLLWLWLMLRAIAPALRTRGEHRPLVLIFALSAGSIALFYGAGLMYGRHTHLSMVEYWRWWVVHLWVEGFFEVFATTVIAFLFARLQLIRPRLAAEASLMAATIYLAGGIIGTNHHLYFSGTPTVALAWGSTMSALEVVPLLLVGYTAMHDLRTSRLAEWARKYRWPVYFFLARGLLEHGRRGAVRFHGQPTDRALLHAGPQHDGGPRPRGPLRCLRHAGHRPHADVHASAHRRPTMAGRSPRLRVLGHEHRTRGHDDAEPPTGGVAADVGFRAARLLVCAEPEFLESGWLPALRWLRVPGDTVFAIGAIAVILFIFGLRFGWSLEGGVRPREARARSERAAA